MHCLSIVAVYFGGKFLLLIKFTMCILFHSKDTSAVVCI